MELQILGILEDRELKIIKNMLNLVLFIDLQILQMLLKRVKLNFTN